MKFAEAIPPDMVFPTAMRLLRRARREVVLTMDMQEEEARPLPVAYHRRIGALVRRGIRVRRYGYGTKRQFARLAGGYRNITFRFGGSMTRYQRMLIVDGEAGLFRIAGHVYYTSYAPLLTALRAFAEGTV